MPVSYTHLLALTANLINEFFLPFSVKYKGVPFECQYLHPVSYTHLDVYKRQVKENTVQEVRKALQANIEAIQRATKLLEKQSDTPVSYTHLDVYKRQFNDSKPGMDRG